MERNIKKDIQHLRGINLSKYNLNTSDILKFKIKSKLIYELLVALASFFLFV